VPVPVDLVLVQDDSDSMWLKDPGAAIRTEAASLALELVGLDVSGAGDRFAFASFGSSDQAQVIPLRPVRGAVDRAAILRWIRAMTSPKGSTDYDSGLRAAIDALQDRDDAYASPRGPRYRASGRAMGVVLLSDGQPQATPFWPFDRRGRGSDDPVLDLFRDRGWPLFTIGVGLASEACAAHRVLARVAERTGGLAYAPGDLRRICSAIVTEIRHREAAARPWEGDRGSGDRILHGDPRPGAVTRLHA
jgi:hypothetical protein